MPKSSDFSPQSSYESFSPSANSVSFENTVAGYPNRAFWKSYEIIKPVAKAAGTHLKSLAPVAAVLAVTSNELILSTEVTNDVIDLFDLGSYFKIIVFGLIAAFAIFASANLSTTCLNNFKKRFNITEELPAPTIRRSSLSTFKNFSQKVFKGALITLPVIPLYTGASLGFFKLFFVNERAIVCLSALCGGLPMSLLALMYHGENQFPLTLSLKELFKKLLKNGYYKHVFLALLFSVFVLIGQAFEGFFSATTFFTGLDELYGWTANGQISKQAYNLMTLLSSMGITSLIALFEFITLVTHTLHRYCRDQDLEPFRGDKNPAPNYEYKPHSETSSLATFLTTGGAIFQASTISLGAIGFAQFMLTKFTDGSWLESLNTSWLFLITVVIFLIVGSATAYGFDATNRTNMDAQLRELTARFNLSDNINANFNFTQKVERTITTLLKKLRRIMHLDCENAEGIPLAK